MSDAKRYVVMGSVGEYSDRVVWAVAALDTEADAEGWAECCRREAMDIGAKLTALDEELGWDPVVWEHEYPAQFDQMLGRGHDDASGVRSALADGLAHVITYWTEPVDMPEACDLAIMRDVLK